jgi:hypothetical protein
MVIDPKMRRENIAAENETFGTYIFLLQTLFNKPEM